MTGEIALSDEPAEGIAEHDRPFDTEYIAKAHHVIGPCVECPLVGHSPVAAPVAAVVVHDELGDVSQWAEPELRSDVIEARTAMHRDDRRPVSHLRAIVIGYESEPIDVDEQPDPVPNVHTHRKNLSATTKRKVSLRGLFEGLPESGIQAIDRTYPSSSTVCCFGGGSCERTTSPAR